MVRASIGLCIYQRLSLIFSPAALWAGLMSSWDFRDRWEKVAHFFDTTIGSDVSASIYRMAQDIAFVTLLVLSVALFEVRSPSKLVRGQAQSEESRASGHPIGVTRYSSKSCLSSRRRFCLS